MDPVPPEIWVYIGSFIKPLDCLNLLLVRKSFLPLQAALRDHYKARIRTDIKIIGDYREETPISRASSLIHGTIRVFKNDEIVKTRHYINGIAHGWGFEHAGNQEIRTFYRKHKKEIEEVYVDGILIRKCEFFDGHKHGIEEHYRDGKLLKSTYYYDGFKHGEEIENRGSVTMIRNFKYDVLNGICECITPDRRHVTHFRAGIKHGLEQFYRKDKLHKTVNYKMGKRHQELVKFYRNGQKRCVYKYKMGFRHGSGYHYYEDGLVKKVVKYCHNFLWKEIMFDSCGSVVSRNIIELNIETENHGRFGDKEEVEGDSHYNHISWIGGGD